MILISSNCAIIPESSCLERGQIIWRSAVSHFPHPSPLSLLLFSTLLLRFLSLPPCVSFQQLTVVLLSSGLLVRLLSTVAATVKRDIFHKQKIAKEGVRTCAPKASFSCFANSAQNTESRPWNVFSCLLIELQNEKSQMRKVLWQHLISWQTLHCWLSVTDSSHMTAQLPRPLCWHSKVNTDTPPHTE